MGERIGRIGQMETDFLSFRRKLPIGKRFIRQEKSVSIRPIRLIRSPIVSLFSKTETNPRLQNRNQNDYYQQHIDAVYECAHAGLQA
jgi:hypothetical protein